METKGSFERGGGGLFNLAKVVATVCDKELESQENKLKQDSKQVHKPSRSSPR